MNIYNIISKISNKKNTGDDSIKLFDFKLKDPNALVEIIIKEINNNYTADRQIRYILQIGSSYNSCSIMGELLNGTFLWPHQKTLFEESCFIGNDYGVYGLYLKTTFWFNSNRVAITINDYGNGQSNSEIYNIATQSLIESSTPSSNSCLSTNILDKKYTKIKHNNIFDIGVNNPPGYVDNWDNIIQLAPLYGYNNVTDIPVEDGNLQLPYQSLIGINSTHELGRNIGNNLYSYDGNPLGTLRSGTSSQRPIGIKVGFLFFDTSLGTVGKPIWYAGKDGNNQDVWVDATGTTV